MKEEKIKFSIERLDPLGQGVSKVADKITFIPKTLPGEEGTAKITGKKKGIQFAQVIEFTQKSEKRIDPACPHFGNCSGCDYLHSSYHEELINKKDSLERLLKYSRLEPVEIQVHGAPERFNYRNRVQLHYDTSKKKLGYFQGKSKKILEVPSCLLPQEELSISLDSFYENQNWLSEVPSGAPVHGHVELYLKDGVIQKTWNESYSAGGFSQVNEAMNQLCLKLWQKSYEEFCEPQKVFDVFGGSGNITKSFTSSRVDIFDSYCDNSLLLPHQRFISRDLFKEPTPPNETIDFLIFDPPRSGFKETTSWVASNQPSFLAYQSCFADTMFRDLKDLPRDWKISSLHLLDFFPGSHHYETLIFLKKETE